MKFAVSWIGLESIILPKLSKNQKSNHHFFYLFFVSSDVFAPPAVGDFTCTHTHILTYTHTYTLTRRDKYTHTHHMHSCKRTQGYVKLENRRVINSYSFELFVTQTQGN